MEITPSFKFPSSQLMGNLGFVAPVLLMILLLLLCSPFKKKKRQLSARIVKRDLNMSELISMTKLGDGLPLERKSLADRCLCKGNTLPSHQAEQQSNGFSSELQQGNADSSKYTQVVNSSQQRMEKLNISHQRNLSPEAPGSNIPSPSPLQFRKLPVTPKEVCISRMLPLTQNLDNQVYESIGTEGQELCTNDWLEGRKGSQLTANKNSICATAHGFGAGPVELGGKDSEAAGSSSTHVQLSSTPQCQESYGQLQEMTPEKEVPPQLDSDSRRLSAMYARVCKRTKASQPVQPEKHDEPMEQEEEEPPPIPEKCFEHIYESLNIDSEMQVGGL
ncbi:uncharacterized protein LOC134495267 [Candoia aspera]|uniref:uncharacterized protein LOC134495267 n=1 Tax=Candoia aspera TaxID=51853 RepID=UPI002FD860AD